MFSSLTNVKGYEEFFLNILREGLTHEFFEFGIVGFDSLDGYVLFDFFSWHGFDFFEDWDVEVKGRVWDGEGYEEEGYDSGCFCYIGFHLFILTLV
jgi:hypothetical protein